jgi:hypothetical protein
MFSKRNTAELVLSEDHTIPDCSLMSNLRSGILVFGKRQAGTRPLLYLNINKHSFALTSAFK